MTISLTEKIAPVAPPADTPWIKQVSIKSQILSDFWGLPIMIGAEVLLPKGFADNPNARYPAIYTFGHFGGSFSFNTNPASDTPNARAAAADGESPDRLSVYAAVDRRRLPPRRRHLAGDAEPVLPRVLRAEFGEQRAVGRRDPRS